MIEYSAMHNHPGSEFLFIAGPCSLESKEQIQTFLQQTRQTHLRAGLFKMRTKADSFQGLGKKGIAIIADLKKTNAFDFYSEITDPRQLEELADIVDVFQVGSRNMYNYELLRELNYLGRPVILKRAFSATLSEWINACEYMPDLNEKKIILCERGIRSFEPSYRNCLDLNAVVYLKETTDFKVIVDPSHACGKASMVAPLAKASVMAGADGLLIESHPEPKRALSDAEQALNLEELLLLRQDIQNLCLTMGRKVTF